MVLLLSGEVVLVEDTKTPLRAGDVACWPAGMAIGHCIHNQSGAEARYLVIGAKHRLDVIHYPHQDLVAHKSGPVRAYFDANGRPL